MKKILFFIACLSMALTMQAQDPNTFTVHLKNGASVAYNVDEIDYLTFDAETTVPGETPDFLMGKVFEIQVPEINIGVDDPVVYRVMDGGQQVAEVCLEYVRTPDGSTDEQMLVAYPIANDDKADLTKGFTLKDGGSLVWNKENNTCTYTKGSGSGVPSVIYLDNGHLSATTSNSTPYGTDLEKYILKDKRGAETEQYDIVKIGTQYWMAENLRAAYLTSGSPMTYYKSTQGSQFSSTTLPANHIAFDDTETSLSAWGRMYNGYAVLSGSLAPEGWSITSLDDWKTLKTYLGSAPSSKVRAAFEWNDTPGNGTNLSGLSIPPGGIFMGSGDFEYYQWSRAVYWTSTETSDLFGKGLAVATVYENLTLDSSGEPMSHSYGYGHYVRCIRE